MQGLPQGAALAERKTGSGSTEQGLVWVFIYFLGIGIQVWCRIKREVGASGCD